MQRLCKTEFILYHCYQAEKYKQKDMAIKENLIDIRVRNPQLDMIALKAKELGLQSRKELNAVEVLENT